MVLTDLIVEGNANDFRRHDVQESIIFSEIICQRQKTDWN